MTDTNNQAPFKDVLYYEDELPIRWKGINWPVTPNYLDAINRENELLLQVLLSSDETLPEKEEEIPEAKTELRHLDTKINLLLNWVGNLMMQASPLPESQRIRISAFGIAFNSTPLLTPGEYLLVEWFPDHHYPQALKLFVHVLEYMVDTDNIEQRADQPANTIAEFVGGSEHVQDLISKYIFRHHRRGIAQQKRMKQKDE